MIKFLINKGWINKSNYHKYRLLLSYDQYKYFDNLKLKLYFDMDEVLCDYKGMYKQVSELYPDLTYPQSTIGFFLKLEPINGSIEAFNKLKKCGKYECYILTRPSVKNTHCYTEKAEWIKKHLGEDVLDNMMLACDKSLVKGDYLIDDSITDGQMDFEGFHIHFGTDKFPDWDSVLNYLL